MLCLICISGFSVSYSLTASLSGSEILFFFLRVMRDKNALDNSCQGCSVCCDSKH